MISFGPRSPLEAIKRLYPPYRRAQDAKMREAIRYLIDHPETPCAIFGQVIQHGYGTAADPLSARFWGMES